MKTQEELNRELDKSCQLLRERITGYTEKDNESAWHSMSKHNSRTDAQNKQIALKATSLRRGFCF